jgi:hypothetical protein
MSGPAAPPPVAPAEPAGFKSDEILTKGKESRKDNIKAMFAEPSVEPEPQAAPAVTPSEPQPPAQPIKEPAPSIIDDDLEDFNQRPAKPTPAAPGEPEPPKPEDREERSITTLREQLGIQGRRAKELEMTLVEKDLKLKTLEEELTALRADAEKPSRFAQNPMASPTIAKISDSIIKDRNTFARSLRGNAATEFTQNFESMLRDHAAIENAANPETERQLVDALHERIGASLGDDQIRDVMKILADNSGKYVNMRQMIDNIGTLAEEEEIQSKVTGWDDSKAKAATSINSIADVNDEFIAANPNSPQSFVAKMIKEDPAYKDRADKVKIAVIEAFNGKRPLTRDEMARLKENEEVSGVKVSDFLKERSKREEANRAEMMKRAYLATMLLPELPDILADSAKVRQKQQAQEAERIALLGGTQDRSSPTAGGEDYVRAQDRPSAVKNVLDVMKKG